jgi:hypothetical protein
MKPLRRSLFTGLAMLVLCLVVGGAAYQLSAIDCWGCARDPEDCEDCYKYCGGYSCYPWLDTRCGACMWDGVCFVRDCNYYSVSCWGSIRCGYPTFYPYSDGCTPPGCPCGDW